VGGRSGICTAGADLPQALAVHSARDWEDVLESARDFGTDRAGAGTQAGDLSLEAKGPSETLAEL